VPKISVVVPAYNEEAGIGVTLRELLDATQGMGTEMEILVVDDGSTDRTVEIARSFGVRVVSHPTNLGKGAAMKTGWKNSKGEYLIFTDADGTYPARFVPQIVEALRTADVVFTYRNNREHIPLFNRLGNWVIARAVRSLSGFVGRDPLSGLYGMRRAVLDAVGLDSATFAVETEIAVKVSRTRFNAIEIPVEYRPRLGTSKLRPLRDGARVLRVLLDLLFIYHPYLTFGAPGLFLFLLGLLLATALTVKGGLVLGRIHLAEHSLMGATALVLLGATLKSYAIIIDLYAVSHKFKKTSGFTRMVLNPRFFNMLRVGSGVLLALSIFASVYHVRTWIATGFGPFVATKTWLLSLTGVLFGLQGLFISFIGYIFVKDCLESYTCDETSIG
jgi:glycosyltransferase involved in cell wall biosynthesis